MARPTSRRPGQNRRAQYGLFASYVIAVSGALFGLFDAVSADLDECFDDPFEGIHLIVPYNERTGFIDGGKQFGLLVGLCI